MTTDTELRPRTADTVVRTRLDRAGPRPSTREAVRSWTHRARDSARRPLTPLWEDRRLGATVAVVMPAGWGLLAGWWTPRGPLTSGEAIWSLVLSLGVEQTYVAPYPSSCAHIRRSSSRTRS